MARLPRLAGPLADCNQGLNWREKFETCPGWGAKLSLFTPTRNLACAPGYQAMSRWLPTIVVNGTFR
jgi:hypothetical protein